MRCPYAVIRARVISPDGLAEVTSTHTMLHKALETVKNLKEQGFIFAQVRELAAPAVVGERIHYTHLRRWD